MNNSYTYPSTASNVHAYVIDTGIRISHNDFGGRATHGRDVVENDNVATDCHGHGTHVAGTLGGSAYGVAKGVQLVAVRVFDCSGIGYMGTIAAGVDWVTANAVRPAVVNMSLGGPPSSLLDDAVRNSVNSGLSYVLAAGNENSNACGSTPARVNEAITVGATTITDARALFSNYGNCLDLFAPGENILAPWYTSNSATASLSGTSMASPHVAGAAALFLANNTGATPTQVRDHLVTTATTGRVTSPGPGSPNRLLFVQESAAAFVLMLQAADFNGDAVDDLALRRGSEYFLDTNLDGIGDTTVRWGRTTDGHFIGDFNGDGTDDLALRRGSEHYLDTNLDGIGDTTVGWGRSNDGLVARHAS